MASDSDLAFDDTIGAFVPHSPAPKAGAGKGPLAGLRLAVKDLFDTEGDITGGGSPDWYEHAEPATDTAPVVTKLLEAGAALIGKTICDEFFYNFTGENHHYGTPENVRAPGRLPGGSSSGSAAATAAGLCDIALGSDTGGSVRVPASFCGLYGLRPTFGRLDMTWAMVMAPSFDTAGWFTDQADLFQTVGGLLLEGSAVVGTVKELLLAEEAFEISDDGVSAAINGVLMKTGDVLPPARTLALSPAGLDDWKEIFRIIQAYEVWQAYGEWILEHDPTIGPGIKDRLTIAETITADEAAHARKLREAVKQHLTELVPVGTLLALPTTPCIAPKKFASSNDLNTFRGRTLSMTCIAGLAGLPQVTIPLVTVDGCPIGMSFIAWPGGDEALLDLAVKLAKSLSLDG